MTRSAPPGEHDFDALFRDHAAEVFRTMYAFTAGRRDVAEETTAEAFARALAHAEGIRDPLPWIHRTAFRIAKEELRRERRTTPGHASAEQVPAGLGELIDALRRLSPQQRAAIGCGTRPTCP